MSRIKVKNQITLHSRERFQQRVGIKDQRAQKQLVNCAIKHGLNARDFWEGSPLRKWMLVKGRYKRIKIYDGFVYVISKNSNKCYTVYKLPEEFREEYEQKIRKW